MAGITPSGFTLKTLEEIQTDIGQEQLATIDPALDVSSDDPLGQANAIVARQAALIWELAQTCYNAPNPNAAEGVLLENLCALSGTIRRQATKSTVTLTLGLDAGTTIPIGAIANVVGQPGNRFLSTNTVTAGATGTYSLTFEAEFAGPVTANAGTITVITTPISGWTSVNNFAAATVGLARETDTELRARRAQEIAAPGASTADALLADVSRVPGVIQASIFENPSDIWDSNGLPPHSFEVLIWDGVGLAASNTDLGQTIWDAKPAGIQTYGNTNGGAYDSNNIFRTVKFSRATAKTLDAFITVSLLPGWTPSQITDIQTEVSKIVWKMGQDVITTKIIETVRKVSPLIHDVPQVLLILGGGAPTSGNQIVLPRDIAVWGTITVIANFLTGVP